MVVCVKPMQLISSIALVSHKLPLILSSYHHTTTTDSFLSRKQAEQTANVKVIGINAMNRAAKYAKEGNYEEAQLEARAAQRFMLRNNAEEDNMNKWVEKAESMDHVLRTELEKEKKSGLESDGKFRQKTRSDETATAISKVTKANSKKVWS